MKIIPAIDLLDGKCVRLFKGDYSKISNYNNNPVDQINEFTKAGFDYIHIIDINAAKSGGDENLLLIEEISQIKNIKIPVLVMHGEADQIVPFWMGKKIFDLANNPKYSYFTEYDDHMMEYDSKLVSELNNFLKGLN